MKITALSASDSTDDWPYWMVWDGQRNVTLQAREAVEGRNLFPSYSNKFCTREEAETLAAQSQVTLPE